MLHLKQDYGKKYVIYVPLVRIKYGDSKEFAYISSKLASNSFSKYEAWENIKILIIPID